MDRDALKKAVDGDRRYQTAAQRGAAMIYATLLFEVIGDRWDQRVTPGLWLRIADDFLTRILMGKMKFGTGLGAPSDLELLEERYRRLVIDLCRFNHEVERLPGVFQSVILQNLIFPRFGIELSPSLKSLIRSNQLTVRALLHLQPSALLPRPLSGWH